MGKKKWKMYGYFVISDLPTLDIFVPMLFWKKIGSEIPYLPMVWTYVQIFVGFFICPYFAKVDGSAKKSGESNLSRPRLPFSGPLSAILDYTCIAGSGQVPPTPLVLVVVILKSRIMCSESQI